MKEKLVSFFFLIKFKISCINRYVIVSSLIIIALLCVVLVSSFSLTSTLIEIGEKSSIALNITNKTSWKNKSVFDYNSVYMYDMNGRDIKISVKKGSKTEALETVIDYLHRSPFILLEGCTDIIISPEEIQTESVQDELIITEFEAFTYKSTMYFHDKYICEDTFWHEAGHIFDIYNGYPSQNAEFLNIYNSQKFPSIMDMSHAYCDSTYEGWAIATAVYFMSPKLFEAVDKEIYEYFDNIYN